MGTISRSASGKGMTPVSAASRQSVRDGGFAELVAAFEAAEEKLTDADKKIKWMKDEWKHAKDAFKEAEQAIDELGEEAEKHAAAIDQQWELLRKQKAVIDTKQAEIDALKAETAEDANLTPISTGDTINDNTNSDSNDAGAQGVTQPITRAEIREQLIQDLHAANVQLQELEHRYFGGKNTQQDSQSSNNVEVRNPLEHNKDGTNGQHATPPDTETEVKRAVEQQMSFTRTKLQQLINRNNRADLVAKGLTAKLREKDTVVELFQEEVRRKNVELKALQAQRDRLRATATQQRGEVARRGVFRVPRSLLEDL